jgi:hypothetical protein
MTEALVTLLGEPKKYGVLVDREQVEEKSGRTKRNGTGVGRGFPLDNIWRRCRSGIDEPKKSSPAGFPGFGGDVEGSIKERLKDEAEEVERG